ncbi:MAG: transaldolase [Parachlamydiales bacterium]|nr:transaldolase [Parachlamydiales bacterium]
MPNLTKEKTSSLDELKKYSTIVADTSDFELISKYKPQDATTNPSLILKASQMDQYKHLIEDAKKYAKSKNNDTDAFVEKVFVNFGKEILKNVPGRVSIEVDAKYSFDTNKSIEIAKRFISLFEKENISRERILIKLATTWEGIQAAKVLEKENIHCNMTLLFSMPQAIAAAEVKATLISPFVGRILDWYKKAENKQFYPPSEDPGVKSVTDIFNYYKKFDYNTVIMGASFRNTDEIIELAGCDFITISPNLLEELHNSSIQIKRKLDPQKTKQINIEKINIDEKTFRYMLNQDPMATEKLCEGIRLFEKDLNLLKRLFI